MDVEDQGIFLRGIEIVRLDNERVDAAAGRRRNPHLLRRADIDLVFDLLVAKSQPAHGAPCCFCLPNITRLTHGATHECDLLSVGRQCEGLNCFRVDDACNLFCADVHTVQGDVTLDIRCEINVT